MLPFLITEIHTRKGVIENNRASVYLMMALSDTKKRVKDDLLWTCRKTLLEA
jgi:hypothetical protein